MVQAGRADELNGFEARGVYEIRTRAWAKANGILILGTRWMDKLKGECLRSRLVAQDFNYKKGKIGPDELFAPTPPLIAARYCASRCASSSGLPRRLSRKLMTLHFEKAFLNGSVLRDVCINLPGRRRSRKRRRSCWLSPKSHVWLEGSAGDLARRRARPHVQPRVRALCDDSMRLSAS